MSNVLSTDILVFPSTKRGNYQLTARLMTEQYMVNIINELVETDAFVITKNTSEGNIGVDNKFEFNIHGYYFNVASVSDILNGSSATESIYANIVVDSVDNYIELVGQDTGGASSVYMGVTFTDDAPDDTALSGASQTRYSLKILEKDGTSWKVPESSFVKFSSDSILGAISSVDGGQV